MVPYWTPRPCRCATTDQQLPAQVFPNGFPSAVDSRQGMPQDCCLCFTQVRASTPDVATSSDIGDRQADVRHRHELHPNGRLPTTHRTPEIEEKRRRPFSE